MDKHIEELEKQHFRHKRGFWEYDFDSFKKKIVFMQSHTLRARREPDSQRGHRFILQMKKMMLKKKSELARVAQLVRS